MISGLSTIHQGYGNARLSDDELLDSIVKVAKRGGYNDVIKKLAAREIFSENYPQFNSALLVVAAACGNDKLVDEISRCEHVLSKVDTCKARCGGVNYARLTALMLAITFGYYEITEALIKVGADVKQVAEHYVRGELDNRCNLDCLSMALWNTTKYHQNGKLDKMLALLLRKGAKAVGLRKNWPSYRIAPVVRLRAFIDKNIYDDQLFFGVNGFNDKPFSLRKLAMRQVAKKVMPDDLPRLCIPEDLKYDLLTYKKDAVDDLIHTVCPDRCTS